MTTNVIDLAFHGSAFPATYTGKGDIIGNPSLNRTGDVISGYFTGKGNAVSIAVGFAPTLIEIVDVSNTIVWDWRRGFPATNTVKTLAGSTGASDTVTTAVDTGSAIAVSVDLAGNGVVTLSATLAADAAVLVYRIHG